MLYDLSYLAVDLIQRTVVLKHLPFCSRHTVCGPALARQPVAAALADNMCIPCLDGLATVAWHASL